MYKSLRAFALALTAVPTLLYAQKQPQQLCIESKVQEQVEVALVSLESQKELKVLAELNTLSKLENIHSLSSIGSILANQNFAPENSASFDSEKIKTFDKTYKVSKNDILAIENKFGKVHVNTWNKNEIRVKVDIIGRAGSDARAQEIVDKINIEESKSGNRISVKTEMQKMNISGNSNRSFEVNYTIYMPDDNDIAIKNSFGDVFLPDFKGRADLDVRYGSLKAQRMSNSGNKLNLAYGNGNCSYINKGDISVAYSNFNLEGANEVKGSSKFSDFSIGNLNGDISLDVKHGNLKVANISSKMQNINLNSGFSNVNLNFEDNTAFNFVVSVQFGDFNVNKNLVNITSLEKGHTSAEYKGKFGSSAAKGSVNIKSKYGDVKFTN